MSRFSYIKIILLILISFIPVSCCFGLEIKPDKVVIKRKTIEIQNWHTEHNNLKIVLLSDLHVGSPFNSVNKLKKIVEITNQENPDMIFLLGDYMNEFTIGGKYVEPQLIVNELAKLKSQYGVVAILGNHDWGDFFSRNQYKHKFLPSLTSHRYINDAIELENGFQNANIQLLENEAEKITINGKGFWIAGLSDVKAGKPDPDILTEIQKDNNPILVLSHNPDILPIVPEYVSLILAGHTHGGQTRLPFVGDLYFSFKTRNLYKSGYFIKKKRHIYITTGTGTSTLPIRWAKPEIVIINIVSKN